MITYSKDKFLPALREMWSLSFSDSTEFMALYFSKVYKPEETLVFVERDVPIASLQMIPYSLKLGDTQVPACYISGAMTHPDYRNNGYMERLLLYAFDVMKRTNVAVAFLIPQDESLVDYYAQYGFQGAFPRYFRKVTVFKDLIPAMKTYPLPSGMDMSYLYRSLLLKKKNVFLKTEQQIKLIFEDVAMSEGIVYVCASGIAIVYFKGRQVIIKELLADSERAKHALLSHISEKYQQDELTVCEYLPGENTSPGGMLKLIDESLTLPDDIYMSMMLE
jgi:predicted acetyltransferase